MAFRNTATAAPKAVENSGFKKADAFINLAVPGEREDGSVTAIKLDPIKLYVDNGAHAQLVQMFKEDSAKATEWLKANLIVDFREATGTTGLKLKI